MVGSSDDTAAQLTRTQERSSMAKKARKKKARKNSKANHGKRPNS
jgi:hypothetical protein